MLSILSVVLIIQDGSSIQVRPEPHLCEQSIRDEVTRERLWCPGELSLQIPRSVLASAPIEGIGSGWATLLCKLNEGGVTTACEIIEESKPGSRFGQWAVRAQLRAAALIDENGPFAGDRYYAIARWQVQ